MRKYNLENISEFEKLIHNCKIKVPMRSKGRKTLHTELYTFRNLLYQIRQNSVINFPIELYYQDKPDFKLMTREFSIGIEVTESIPEQLARAQSLLEKKYPDGGVLEPNFYNWQCPDRTNEEIIEILDKSQKQLIGQGYTGNSVEVLWAQGIVGCIKNKSTKLRKPEFKKYDYNWLLIYDNQIRSFIDKSLVTDLLSRETSDYFETEEPNTFDQIIIESGEFYYFLKRDEILIEMKMSRS